MFGTKKDTKLHCVAIANPNPKTSAVLHMNLKFVTHGDMSVCTAKCMVWPLLHIAFLEIYYKHKIRNFIFFLKKSVLSLPITFVK